MNAAPPTMKGKTCLVTGTTAGIGKVTAAALAKLGARVVTVARDATRGEATAAAIRQETGGEVHFLRCDLSSQADIRSVAREYLAKFDRLDVLVNNAGAVLGTRRTTVDGIEATFATNHLAYFLLTNLLLDVLRASAPARIVSVASDAHRRGPLVWDDLRIRTPPLLGHDGLWRVEAGQHRLERRARSTPRRDWGYVELAAPRGGGDPVRPIRYPAPAVRAQARSPVFHQRRKGAETTLYLATSPLVAGVNGKYFSKKAEALPNAQARNPETGRRLWEESERLIRK